MYALTGGRMLTNAISPSDFVSEDNKEYTDGSHVSLQHNRN